MARFLPILLLFLFSGQALAVVSDKGPVLDLLIKGSELHFQGDLESAENVLIQAVDSEPDNVFALNQLGLVLAKQERFDEAVLRFEQAAALEDNVFALTWLAILALGRDDADAANGFLDRVLELDPANAEAHYVRGVILAAQGEARAGLASLGKAQEADSQDPEVHYRLALAFLDLDMVLNARLELEKTLALEPGHLRAMDRLGWLYYNSGYAEEAMALWRRGLESGDEQARSNLAKAWLDSVRAAIEAGDVGEAARLCRMIQAVDPGNKAAAYYLDYYLDP